jgi:membrane protein implicated in regulation of membrane protease activity
MNTVISSTFITVIYLALLGVGILYAILILIGSELHGLHIPGLDIHLGGHDINLGHDINIGPADGGGGIDHPSVKVPSLSPITIASFVTAFGAFGLIALGLFNTSTRASLAWAAVGGLIVAIIAHFAFGYFLIAPQGSSEVRLRDLVGSEAEVITPIPADSVGEIAFVAQGGRVTYTAQSTTKTPIPRGATVVIEKVIGGVAMVRTQPTTAPDGKIE